MGCLRPDGAPSTPPPRGHTHPRQDRPSVAARHAGEVGARSAKPCPPTARERRNRHTAASETVPLRRRVAAAGAPPRASSAKSPSGAEVSRTMTMAAAPRAETMTLAAVHTVSNNNTDSAPTAAKSFSGRGTQKKWGGSSALTTGCASSVNYRSPPPPAVGRPARAATWPPLPRWSRGPLTMHGPAWPPVW